MYTETVVEIASTGISKSCIPGPVIEIAFVGVLTVPVSFPQLLARSNGPTDCEALTPPDGFGTPRMSTVGLPDWFPNPNSGDPALGEKNGRSRCPIDQNSSPRCTSGAYGNG